MTQGVWISELVANLVYEMSMAIKQSTQILTTARFTVQAKYKNMMSL